MKATPGLDLKRLKPCPFCGEKKLEIMTGEDENYWVVCKKCLAEGPTSNLSSVIYVWNKRK